MIHPPTFSFAIVACLLTVLAASGMMFYLLTRRWTQDRPRAAIEDWAADRRFSLRLPPRATMPSAFDSLKAMDAHIAAALSRGPDVLLKFTTTTGAIKKESRWHVLIRTTDHSLWPAGLKPIGRSASIVDLFTMTDYPTLLPPERFIVVAGESRAARAMANSPARGLLPPDVGLMVHGPFVTLDFSTRPFDPIEFDRMLAVMEQVVAAMG